MGIRCVACLALSLFLVGCAPSKSSNNPKTYPVKGVVTYKGQPVDGATVMFMAKDAKGRGAVGKTDASGGFTLTTFEAADGALPGSYSVMIFKTVLENVPTEVGQPTKPGEEPFSGTEKDMLPLKYKDASKSGLSADVKETGENSVTFDLTD